MGSKPSNSFQMNPPDSGGTARERRTDNSGELEQEKERFAQKEQEQKADAPAGAEETEPQADGDA